MPSPIATNAERPIENRRTAQFIETSSSRGKSAGATESRPAVPSRAINRPARQLIVSSASASVTNWRISRARSEERRVGKEGRSGGAGDEAKKNERQERRRTWT